MATPQTALSVRRAMPEDRDHIATALTGAFFEDPVVVWMIPDVDRRHQVLPTMFALFADAFLPHGEVRVTGDGIGAGLWLPPGVGTGATGFRRPVGDERRSAVCPRRRRGGRRVDPSGARGRPGIVSAGGDELSAEGQSRRPGSRRDRDRGHAERGPAPVEDRIAGRGDLGRLAWRGRDEHRVDPVEDGAEPGATRGHASAGRVVLGGHGLEGCHPRILSHPGDTHALDSIPEPPEVRGEDDAEERCVEGNTRRAIDFREGEKVDKQAFKQLVRAAVALNQSKAKR